MADQGPSGESAPPAAGASSTTQPTDAAPCSLVDMPAAWLQQLPAALGYLSVESLFGCCRALRDLVLSQRRLKVTFTLPLEPEEEAAARASLLLACKNSSNFKLCLSCKLHSIMAHNYCRIRAARASASARQLLTSTMAEAGRALTSITSVELQSLDLDGLVPPWLTSTCPNTTRLCFWRCRFKLPAPTASSLPPCPQLKHLLLDHSGARRITDQPELLQWQHQLRALTGLNSLSMDDTGAEFLLQGCSVIGPQLTQLSVSDIFWSMEVSDLRQLVTCFPHVCDLQLPNHTVDDEDMEVLLDQHSLRKLQCTGFQLQHSYTRRPCPWTHLGFTEVDVASMDRLPLEGVQFTCPVRSVTSSPELAVNERVAAAAVRPITPELLAVMAHHLSRAEVKAVCFHSSTGTPEAWRLLLPSMPPAVGKVGLAWRQDEMSEADLTEMCVRACRPLVVGIKEGCNRRWQQGWEGRVEAAMAAAGHHHVRFVCEYGTFGL